MDAKPPEDEFQTSRNREEESRLVAWIVGATIVGICLLFVAVTSRHKAATTGARVLYWAIGLACLIWSAWSFYWIMTAGRAEKNRHYRMKSDGRQQYAEHKHERRHGDVNRQLVCPHCQVKGKVRATSTTQATGTKGPSILTGWLFRTIVKSGKKCHCDNCGTSWDVLGS